MHNCQYPDAEKALNKVFVKQDRDLSSIDRMLAVTEKEKERRIAESEQLLQSFGVTVPKQDSAAPRLKKSMPVLRSWAEISNEAEKSIAHDAQITDIFTPEELQSNEEYLKLLREEFNTLHTLDAIDYAIAGLAGTLATVMDIVLIGTPTSPIFGLKSGPLAQYIRDLFDKSLPVDKIKELEDLAKVTYDAQDNRNTKIWVEGLSSTYHRIYELGHDPILGFIVGVLDMLKGTMTTIDRNGKIVVQAIDVYQNRKATNLFQALGKVFTHMRSDVNTPMGLPAPLMGLFSLFKGKIDGQIVGDIVRGMYGHGYDFQHFCSMSIPVMVIEVIVRVSYCIKRMSEGHTLRESLPIGLNREKKPKLTTMLWIAHSASTAINAGKVILTKNPLAINYPQWLAFVRYSLPQLKWVLTDKPALQRKYVQGFLSEEWESIDATLQETWEQFNGEPLLLTA